MLVLVPTHWLRSPAINDYSTSIGQFSALSMPLRLTKAVPLEAGLCNEAV